jgi:hypothetical protein
MKPANPTQAAGRRYIVQMGILIGAYVAVLYGSIATVNALHPAGALRYLLYLAPVVPVALILPTIVRYFLATDDYERRVITESLAIAAAITALLAVTYGFLEAAGLPRPSAWITWFVLMGSWAVARFVVARHYQQ